MKKTAKILIGFYFLAVLFWGCSSAPDPEILPDDPDAAEQEIQIDEIQPPPPVPLNDLSVTPMENPEDRAAQEQASALEEALNTYQDALTAWERGDLDTALRALDDTYGQILALELPPESPMWQDKDDLRLLIAQRIQEIYASRRSAVHDNHKTIPLEENEHVLAEIKSFQNRERKDFEAAYQRSGRYMNMILEEIEKEGLPEQIAWVPIIESWFKVRALSRARALGLWQFISSTGLRFGLKRDRWIDERMDPRKATRAALKYLSELHDMFGDWTTALAAYNCGEFRVQRVIKNQRINYLDNFWDLYKMLPRETARFTPRFIAALLIVNDPQKYGFELPPPDPPMTYEAITVNKPIQLSKLAQTLGLESTALNELNSELRHNSTPDTSYALKVPPGYGEKALAAVIDLPKYVPPEATYVVHYVRSGETVGGIARRYRTSIAAIARMNNLRGKYLIRVGQRLRVPTSSAAAASSARSRALIQDGENLVYVVTRGDSLYNIARSFNTTVDKIKQANSLSSDLLRVGQKLTIQSGKPEGASLYTVKSGDTPAEIARRHRMSLDYFLNLNGLSRASKIYPGQKLWVTPGGN